MASSRKEKKKTVAGFLTLRITAALLGTFIVMIFIIASSIRSDLSERELKTLELLATENAQIASQFMSTMINKEEVIAAAVKDIGRIAEEDRVQFLKNLLETTERGQNNILSLYYVAEPNTLMPNTPNGMTIFTTVNGASIQNTRFESISEEVYKKALTVNGMSIADPFEKTVDGKKYQVITVFLPVMSANNTLLGMVGCNIDTAVLSSAPYDHGNYKTFNNHIVCGHKTVIINPNDPSTVGKSFADVSPSKNPDRILQAAVDGKPLTVLDDMKDGSRQYRAYIPFYIGNSTTAWLSGTSISEKEFTDQIVSQVAQMIAIAVVGLLFLILICYYGVRRTLKPVTEIEAATRRLADGDLQTQLTVKTNDEFGRLAVSYNEAVATLSSYVQDIDRSMSSMANGNFDVYPSKPFVGDFANIERSITHFIRIMCNTLNKIGEVAETVSSGSGQVSSGAITLSQGAMEQASSVEELTATIEELAEKVRINNDKAQLAGVRVKEAGDELVSSNAHMQEMTNAMNEITRSSKEIEQIIKTIEDIAFQTNILALNAAVEAARAGAAGKGFAVVADEVRNLASKSSEAAKSSTEKIQTSIASVRTGAKIALDAAASLGIVQEKAGSVVDIVDEICSSSKVQLEQIDQISSSSEQISSVIQVNTAASEESAASSEELAAQSQLLKEELRKFKLNRALTGTN